jgi:hypothetical protein
MQEDLLDPQLLLAIEKSDVCRARRALANDFGRRTKSLIATFDSTDACSFIRTPSLDLPTRTVWRYIANIQ